MPCALNLIETSFGVIVGVGIGVFVGVGVGVEVGVEVGIGLLVGVGGLMVRVNELERFGFHIFSMLFALFVV